MWAARARALGLTAAFLLGATPGSAAAAAVPAQQHQQALSRWAGALGRYDAAELQLVAAGRQQPEVLPDVCAGIGRTILGADAATVLNAPDTSLRTLTTDRLHADATFLAGCVHGHVVYSDLDPWLAATEASDHALRTRDSALLTGRAGYVAAQGVLRAPTLATQSTHSNFRVPRLLSVTLDSCQFGYPNTGYADLGRPAADRLSVSVTVTVAGGASYVYPDGTVGGVDQSAEHYTETLTFPTPSQRPRSVTSDIALPTLRLTRYTDPRDSPAPVALGHLTVLTSSCANAG